MKKKKPAKRTAARFAAGFMAAGTLLLPHCTGAGFDPSGNVPEAVYGPPEWFESDTPYDPAETAPEDVYGPPEWFETGDEDPDRFDPRGNENEPMYGPPAEPDEPASFDPAEMEPEDVYGPPPGND